MILSNSKIQINGGTINMPAVEEMLSYKAINPSHGGRTVTAGVQDMPLPN
jgi:hypothetical protein